QVLDRAGVHRQRLATVPPYHPGHFGAMRNIKSLYGIAFYEVGMTARKYRFSLVSSGLFRCVPAFIAHDQRSMKTVPIQPGLGAYSILLRPSCDYCDASQIQTG